MSGDGTGGREGGREGGRTHLLIFRREGVALDVRLVSNVGVQARQIGVRHGGGSTHGGKSPRMRKLKDTGPQHFIGDNFTGSLLVVGIES